ncbi:unnamed protein product [Mytilus edulis]|uniref:PHD-type domain-containing protein n=1 Tax=Mytilus edulis TaxID=6550 RepID=A0A8S3RGM6_MYTED|nr:unnamed protein product [Mytilus edulis]
MPVAQTCQKQAEKMVARSNQILRPVQVGDNVTVPIPSVDRGRGDQRNLLCIVLEHDQTNDQFKLGTKDGILNGSYSRNQFTFSPIRSLALQDVNTQAELSVTEAARQQSVGDGPGFLKCACKTGCVRKTCKCVKSNVLCNSRCHNSLSCLINDGTSWAHVRCAWWIPEVKIGNATEMEPIIDIEKIPDERWALICYLCKEKLEHVSSVV